MKQITTARLEEELKRIAKATIQSNRAIDLVFTGIEEAIEAELDLEAKFFRSGWHTIHILKLNRYIDRGLKNRELLNSIIATISYQMVDGEAVVEVKLEI